MAESASLDEQRPNVVRGADNSTTDSLEIDAEKAYQNLLSRKAALNDTDNDEFESAFDNEVNHHQEISKDNILSVKSKEKEPSKVEKETKENVPDEDTNFPKGNSPDSEFAEMKEHQQHGTPKTVLAQPNTALSPTNSMSSHPSTTSSDPSWSSDMRFSLPQDRRGKPIKCQSLEEAKEEWEQVETVTVGTKTGGICSPLVSFQVALDHFESLNLEDYASNIKPTIKRSGFSSLWYLLSGPPSISNTLKKERDLIFTLGLCPFDNRDSMHNLILQTVYKKLTATTLDCPRHGSHWEVIGFQGDDPATDLRGCGMLGLLNVLYLCTDAKLQSLCRDIYRLSQDEVQNFPFSVMGINITRITLQILREGKLNKDCNQRHSVFEVFNELYAGIYLGVYRVWKTQQKTISDSGFVIREIETSAKKNPSTFSKQLQKTLHDRGKLSDSPTATKSKGANVEKMDKFSGICDLDDNEEEEIHLV